MDESEKLNRVQIWKKSISFVFLYSRSQGCSQGDEKNPGTLISRFLLLVVMCLLSATREQQVVSVRSAQERGSSPLSLEKEFTAKGHILYWMPGNQLSWTRLPEELEQTPAARWQRMNEAVTKGSVLRIRLVPFAGSSLSSVHSLWQNIFVAQNWWAAVQEMGPLPPSASLCQHPIWGQPPCGFVNVYCPGAAHRNANLQHRG